MNYVNFLRLTSAVFAVFWTGLMLRWSGDFPMFCIIGYTLAGCIIGYNWFLFGRWYFRRVGLLPNE
jgi:hypothetical protein